MTNLYETRRESLADRFGRRLRDASECLVWWSKIYLSCITVTHPNHRHAKFIGFDNEIMMVLEIGKNGVGEKPGDMEVTEMTNLYETRRESLAGNRRLGDASECLVGRSKICLSCTTVTHPNHRHAKFISFGNEMMMVLEIGKNGVREKLEDMEVTVMP
ncbi:hypothetical protein EV424DRAFT_1343270 [Suillus variegatus]|nr:hypothetical protein EV424DRAFT_1343270 [Suillus variegatus]